MLKRVINITLWTVVGMFFLIIILLHVPAVQGLIGNEAAQLLSRKLGAEVSVGRIDLGFINRFIIDDVRISDQKGQPLLRAARLSAKVELLPLLQQRVSVSSAQVFGLKVNIYRENGEAAPNYQFILDSLASKEPKEPSRLDLRVSSLIVRHGEAKYRQLDKKTASGTFSPYNIHARNISGHFILNVLTSDSVNARVKKLSLDEDSGLRLKSFSVKMAAGRSGFQIEDMSLRLPQSHLNVSSLSLNYDKKEERQPIKRFHFSGEISNSSVALSDLAFLKPDLKRIEESFSLYAKFTGTDSSIDISDFRADSRLGTMSVLASASAARIGGSVKWAVNMNRLKSDAEGISAVARLLGKEELPAFVQRLGDIVFTGSLNGIGNDVTASGEIGTACGDVGIGLEKSGDALSCSLNSNDFNLQGITGDRRLGLLSADIGIRKNASDNVEAEGEITRFEYNNYRYSGISFNGQYDEGHTIDGALTIDDPNIALILAGKAAVNGGVSAIEAEASVKDFNPQALNLSDKWGAARFSANIAADLKDIRSGVATGSVEVSGFLMETPDSEYRIDNLTINSTREDSGDRLITLEGDFGKATIAGHGDIKTLPESVAQLMGGKLYVLAMGSGKRPAAANEFAVEATINDTQWLDRLLGIPLDISSPITVNGNISDKDKTLNLLCDLDRFSYDGNAYRDAAVRVNTVGDSIASSVRFKKISSKGKAFGWNVKAVATDNILNTTVSMNDDVQHPLRGQIKANTTFVRNLQGDYTAHIDVEESDMHIGDTTWHIRPSSVTYDKRDIRVNNFAMSHGDQYLRIDGRLTGDRADTLHIDFHDVDVGYILDMANFHSVEFGGQASGRAVVAGAFGERPLAKARLTVDDFLFEGGRLGVLTASARYDDIAGRINIDAVADDEGGRQTLVNGYVSPVHNHISLDIKARSSRLEFVEGFCSSFMRDVNAYGDGEVRLSGALNDINLTGRLVVNGTVGISSLNTTYTMRNDTVRFIPDEIEFRRDTVYDRAGNIGIVNGNLHHEHLTNLSYDFDISARNLLCLDTTPTEGGAFYGTVYASGGCRIKGRKGEIVMDIDATLQKSTVITYNIDAQDDSSADSFLIWRKRDAAEADSTGNSGSPAAAQASGGGAEAAEWLPMVSDFRINFLINSNPDATLKVIMDNASGDYIALNGNGTLRAAYYNKGSFDIFGNYVVDHGIYKLTIQNILRRDFSFLEGGTINFGGDPFNANLDLKAQYVLNSVSLADLNIGSSFKNNNVRVNCLMNIAGTPKSPQVTFDLDMPTLGGDARQMVASVINAEEEMNQQVLYLLAVGRFYTQAGNNASADGTGTQRNQASLAMQSILSGTVSQQINTLLGTVMNSSNWNFDANISTGTEGFNDAEYEGILSGSLLNNRLLINGQFGYRDNANATTSFIGDFDLKYLLFPNGNLAINVYNKTNDRYFTRNSLNTQGIGLIMKRDFNSLRDLFGKKKKK